MFKKIYLSTALALVLALVVSSSALAASGTTPPRTVNRLGVITALAGNTFTLQTIGGQSVTVKVSDTTRYHRVSGGQFSFRNLDLGQWVTAIGTFDRQRVLHAATVVIMPLRLNKGKWIGKRAYGTVIEVLPDSRTFTLSTPNGLMRFTVDDATLFSGNRVRRFEALKAGMQAVVGYAVKRDGSLYARGVSAY